MTKGRRLLVDPFSRASGNVTVQVPRSNVRRSREPYFQPISTTPSSSSIKSSCVSVATLGPTARLESVTFVSKCRKGRALVVITGPTTISLTHRFRIFSTSKKKLRKPRVLLRRSICYCTEKGFAMVANRMFAFRLLLMPVDRVFVSPGLHDTFCAGFVFLHLGSRVKRAHGPTATFSSVVVRLKARCVGWTDGLRRIQHSRYGLWIQSPTSVCNKMRRGYVRSSK